MFEAKALSAAIRRRKKDSLRPDMDSAGQEGVDPNTAWDEKQDTEVNRAMGESDHAPASKVEMGENESSQEEGTRKKISARIAKYFSGL